MDRGQIAKDQRRTEREKVTPKPKIGLMADLPLGWGAVRCFFLALMMVWVANGSARAQAPQPRALGCLPATLRLTFGYDPL